MSQYKTDEEYQDHILIGVSRTFALTIPQLPYPLSKVVSNAYLLCRIADTIEDEPNLTATQKREFSQEFIQVVAGESSPEVLSKTLFPLFSESTSEAEKDLILNLPRIIRLTHDFTKEQHTALLRCVGIMVTGMAEFQQHSSLDGLKDLDELERYCYHVAGVVGEMLTDLFCDYSPEINEKKAELEVLAVSFGQALQLTNILKDLWEDQQRGVCWLPRDVFAELGFDLKNLTPGHPSFAEGLSILVGIAHTHLHNALNYTLLIPPKEKGIRRFCLWALGMAILTLRRINKRLNFSAGKQVKISRRSVKATIWISNLFISNDTALQMLFDFLTQPLPISCLKKIV
jgi:farnesyl-diphosphate farnesyltransferase